MPAATPFVDAPPIATKRLNPRASPRASARPHEALFVDLHSSSGTFAGERSVEAYRWGGMQSERGPAREQCRLPYPPSLDPPTSICRDDCHAGLGVPNRGACVRETHGFNTNPTSLAGSTITRMPSQD